MRPISLGFTTLKNFENYLYNHMLNTAILSIAIGKRINLPKNQLSSLGIAAIFHDIGKAEIPRSILNKPSELQSKGIGAYNETSCRWCENTDKGKRPQ